MAIGILQEFEGTPEQYDQVNEKVNLGGDPPDGLQVHCGMVIDDGKIRVFDVWESQEKFDAFMAAKLGPAIAEAMGPDTQPSVFDTREVRGLTLP
jgi:hypothetical protein